MLPSRPSASLRRVLPVLAALLAGSLLVISGRGQAPASLPLRVIVKVSPSLAKDLETALPLQSMELSAGRSGSVPIEAFLAKYSARKVRPVYPAMVRTKKRQRLTDLQIATTIRQKFAKRGSRFRDPFRPPEISRTYILEFDPASQHNLQTVIEALRTDTDVEFAEPDHVASVNFTPNDPYFSSSGSWGQSYSDLWGIKEIGAPSAWDTTAGAGMIVAVVDTGVDYNHPDIAANIWTNPGEIPNNGIDDDHNGYIDDVIGWDFIGSTYTNPTQSNNPIDHFGHGTHVAGTIAAVGNNGIGVIGVAWQSKIMVVKGLDDSGYGLDSTLGPAIIYAASNGADVINNSWGGPGSSQAIAEAINYAHNLGAVIVVAAGNNSDDARNYYPSNVWDAITVSATTPYDTPASFTNYGSKIDVAAPGVDILSLRAAGTSMGTPVDANYTRADGTSMATPHVSGLAVLILSAHPDFSNEDARQAMRLSGTIPTGTSGFNVNYGYGRINAPAALGVSSVLESKISSPADGTFITKPTTISGYALGSGFASYTLQYGAGTSPSSWTTIQTATSPVAGAALGTFDPTVVPDGVYTIRLTAYDVSNNAYVDHIQLTVKYVSITSPAVPIVPNVAAEFKPGAQISVTGTASGPSFSDFRLEWAEGVNPSSGWSSAGMSLTNGGTSPVSNAVLGTWDTSSITSPDYYTIRLFVDNAGFTSDASTLVYLEPSLLSPDWPTSLDQAPYFSSGMVPALDASNNTRLTFVNPVYANTSLPAQFWSVSNDGSSQNLTTINWGDMFQPAVGAFDGTPGQQAIVSENNDLRVFRSDNTSYALTPPIASNLQYASTILEDLNNDSQLEAIALGHVPFSTSAYVYAWHANGTQLNANFPITVPDQNSNLWYPYEARVLAADINGDGYKELIVEEGISSTTFTLGLFAHDGTPLTWSAPTLTGTPYQIALADLDHNGMLETILVLNTGSQQVVHILQPDGTERPSWPVNLQGFGLTAIAVGDLNRDGRDQIVVSTSSSISVLNPDGTSLSAAWPLLATGATSFGPAVLADINADGRPEILFAKSSYASAPSPLLSSVSSSSSTQSTTANSAAQAGPPQITSEKQLSPDGTGMTESIHVQSSAQSFYGGFAYENMQLLALRSDGSQANSWNLLGIAGNQPFSWAAPTVGDFNNDGLSDIALIYFTISGGGISGYLSAGAATVLTSGTAFNPSANDWPMLRQSPRNTAVYRPLLNVSIGAPAAGASVSGLVNLTANVTDKVASPTVQFQIDGANFGAPISTAPYTLSWDTRTVSLGTHTISASASDSSSNSAVSPPVTVTVTAPQVIFGAPASLNLGAIMIGSTTAAQTVTITNSGQATYTLSAVNLTGDFAQTNNCVGSLAAGASCSVNVTFTPTARGAETGTLSVSGNFPGPSPAVNLSGTGQLLQATASPSSLTFGTQPLNTGSTNQVTYSNTGDLPVTITGTSITGDFQESGSCSSPLAPGANCVLNVTFVPTAAGLRTGTLTISGNVNVSVSLSGTGQVGQVSVGPASLPFGNQNINTTSAPQTITVTSNGNGPATITGWSYPQGITVTTSCPFSLASGSSCTFTLTYTPTSPGPLNGFFSFSGSFQNSPATVSLSGTAIGAAGLISPYSLTFGNQALNSTSAPQGLTLFNTGNAPLTISGIAVTGDFAQTNNCGSSVAGGSNCTINVTFQPTAAGTRSGTLQVNANVTPYPATVNLFGTGISVPAPSFSAPSMTFASQRVNTASAAQSVTLANTGSAPLTISSFSLIGDFSQTNNCGTSLSMGGTCLVNITFTPTASGTRSGTLTLNSNAPGTAPSVALTGSGVASIASLTPSAVAFGNQFVGTASAVQTITLMNSGSATLNISSISVSGDFAQSNTCGTALAPNAICNISVTFTPTASGNRSGILSIADDALGGSPQTASLSGTGTAPALWFSPASFSSLGVQRVNTTSPAQTMTITNNGNATLSITSFAITAAFSQTNNCGTSLAVGANCALNVTFAPTVQGPVSGTLSLNSNLPGTPPSFSLNGTGGAPAATLSGTSLTFAAQLVGTTSSVQSVGLTNTGNMSLNISSVTTSGDYAQTNNCPSSLTAGTNCTLNVTFTPTASGARTGTLSIVDDALAGSPQTVTLSGSGYTLSASLNPSSLTFASQLVGTASSPQNVTLTNTGSGTLSITGFTTSGNFAQTNNCPAALSAGGTCTVSVVFVPVVRGTLTGTLTLNSNATGTPSSVSLSGKGMGPVASLSPTSLTFGVQRVSTTSSSQQLTLTNSGDATMSITSIVASGDFAQTNNCNGALSAGQHCNVNVTFTPTASGARSGTLTLTDNAVNGSPQNTVLGGTGVDFSLSVSPASVTVTHGSSASTTVTVSALGGNYNSSVNLQCSGSLPRGMNCNFSPAGVNPGSSSANSTLKINTGGGNGGTPPGSYAITISGTSGSAQHTTMMTLQVN